MIQPAEEILSLRLPLETSFNCEDLRWQTGKNLWFVDLWLGRFLSKSQTDC